VGLPKLPSADELGEYVEGRYHGTGWEPLAVWAEVWPSSGANYVRIFLRRGRGASVRERDFQARCVRYWMKHRTGLEWVVVVYPAAARLVKRTDNLVGIIHNAATQLSEGAPDLEW